MSVLQPEHTPARRPADDELELIERLRRRDEDAFRTLIERYHPSLVRLARYYVSSHAAAEDVAQETWLGVIRGIDRFEGRSSLKTWIFRIMMNRARTRAEREGRSIPFSALWSAGDDPDEPAVDADRFRGPNDRLPGHWMIGPSSWDALPEERFFSAETRARIQEAIDGLPPSQREVITLRDIEGWSSDETCNVLGISESNQRVLLHRARSRVRRALEQYLGEREVRST